MFATGTHPQRPGWPGRGGSKEEVAAGLDPWWAGVDRMEGDRKLSLG